MNRAAVEAEIARLDALSRERELTAAESLLLERAIARFQGRRGPWGLTRALARHGVKRDMRLFRKEAGAPARTDAPTPNSAPLPAAPSPPRGTNPTGTGD